MQSESEEQSGLLADGAPKETRDKRRKDAIMKFIVRLTYSQGGRLQISAALYSEFQSDFQNWNIILIFCNLIFEIFNQSNILKQDEAPDLNQ